MGPRASICYRTRQCRILRGAGVENGAPASGACAPWRCLSVAARTLDPESDHLGRDDSSTGRIEARSGSMRLVVSQHVDGKARESLAEHHGYTRACHGVAHESADSAR